MIGNLLLSLSDYMLLSLIILNARLAVLERPNRSIDQVHNAAFHLVSFKRGGGGGVPSELSLCDNF